jgi:2-amino-4-hydroxy-6-hydroxymethyldihydropteridine diphosphokinase
MAPTRVRAFVALGSNLDGPETQVRSALLALGRLPLTRLAAASSLYSTPPWGLLEQPDFINAVAMLETALAPKPLLETLKRLEGEAGRKPGLRYGPRVLDLDLLWYEGSSLQTPELQLPHPRMHERAFVVLPLAEIAPGLTLSSGLSAAAQAAVLDCSGIRRLKPT